MKQATPTASVVRALLCAVLAIAFAVPRSARAQSAPTSGSGFSALQGFVIDSIHGEPLTNASVIIEGTGRSSITDKNGHYRIDSIPAGKHKVLVLHPLLDTSGRLVVADAYEHLV